MKKIFLYFLTLAAAAACYPVELDRDLSQNGNGMASRGEMITETISGTYGPSTKVTIAGTDASFKWSVGDNLAVHVSNGDSHKYVVTSGGASEAAASASFMVTYEAGYSRDAFAVYPSTIVAADAANYGQSGTALDVTLPSSYTLAQVTGETSPCPMIASNTSETGWTFHQLCSLLRLTVDNIPSGTKRLLIGFNGQKVCGGFSISSTVSPGTSTIATSADASNDKITITNGGEDFSNSVVLNIPLPVGVYSSISVIAYNDVSNGTVLVIGTQSFSYTATRERGVKSTLTPNLHVFSVSNSKSVIIADSNLQASTSDCGANWTWHFATNPWNYNGDNNDKYYHNERISGNGTVKFSGSGSVDQFGWVGASNTAWEGELGSMLNAAMYGISNSWNNSDYGNVAGESLKSDWGNTINDGYNWRTLTAAEWAYLLGIRASGSTAPGKTKNSDLSYTYSTVSNARYTLAQINTTGSTWVNGMIIFPDGITIENTEVTQTGYINREIGNTMYDTWDDGTKCTLDQWNALAAKGCVFLPMGGAYRYKEGSNTPVFQPGTSAGYWSSTSVNSTQAYFVSISKSYVDPRSSDNNLSNDDRRRGHLVRLVRDIN